MRGPQFDQMRARLRKPRPKVPEVDPMHHARVDRMLRRDAPERRAVRLARLTQVPRRDFRVALASAATPSQARQTHARRAGQRRLSPRPSVRPLLHRVRHLLALLFLSSYGLQRLATHNRHFATLWQRVAPSFAALKMAHTQSDIAPSMPQYLRRHVLDCLQTESYDLL